jgi:hypothetical protein
VAEGPTPLNTRGAAAYTGAPCRFCHQIVHPLPPPCADPSAAAPRPHTAATRAPNRSPPTNPSRSAIGRRPQFSSPLPPPLVDNPVPKSPIPPTPAAAARPPAVVRNPPPPPGPGPNRLFRVQAGPLPTASAPRPGILGFRPGRSNSPARLPGSVSPPLGSPREGPDRCSSPLAHSLPAACRLVQCVFS